VSWITVVVLTSPYIPAQRELDVLTSPYIPAQRELDYDLTGERSANEAFPKISHPLT